MGLPPFSGLPASSPLSPLPSVPESSMPPSSYEPSSERVGALLRTLAELTSEERDEVMRSPFLLSLYQVRPLVTARRNGRVSTLVGPPFAPPTRAGDARPAAVEAEEARPTLGATRTRARIQSDERIVEEDEEAGEEGLTRYAARHPLADAELARVSGWPTGQARPLAVASTLDANTRYQPRLTTGRPS
jgi:hypothetical protein